MTIHNKNNHKLFSTERTDTYLIDTTMAKALQAYMLSNRQRMAPYEPQRPAEYYSLAEIDERINIALADFADQRAVVRVFPPKDGSQIIGNINFTNIVFGAF